MSDQTPPPVAGAPIIVAALFGAEDAAYLTALRRAHFPPERNHLDAHLTLFHHLPPSLEAELKHRLTTATRGVSRPHAMLGGLISLGRGVAFRVESCELEAVRDILRDAFASVLTPQDQAGWRPHVTIQNKVQPAVARALKTELEAGFRPRPLAIAGIGCFYYRGGPWEPISRHMFA